MFSYCEDWVVEGDKEDKENPKWMLEEDKAVANLRLQPSLYRSHFLNSDHETFLGELQSGPVLICVKYEQDHFRVLVYTETGIEHFITPAWTVFKPWYNYLLCRSTTSADVIGTVKPSIEKFLLQPIKGDNMQEELISLFEPEFIPQQKVGLLYCRDGQHTEQEMLSNLAEQESPEFREFCEFLGQKVALQNFTGYTGGLDTHNNYSGTHSLYTTFEKSEIMFHVNTMLPYTSNPGQIERKKHIGNDRLMIVFKDGKEPYIPNTIKSKQTVAVILIQTTDEPPSKESPIVSRRNKKDKSKMDVTVAVDGASTSSGASSSAEKPKPSGPPRYYKVSIASRVEIPQCEPYLPDVPIFEKGPAMRDFLLQKIVNICIAMRHSSTFEKKTKREKGVKFMRIIDKYQTTDLKVVNK